jgi:hypothetical protein
MNTRTTYDLDGVTIDLTRVQIDVYGARWTWTGLVTPDRHVPLMQSGTDTPLPLDDVYATYGPLIPAPAPLTSAVLRAVLAPEAPDPQCKDCQDVGCPTCVRPPLPTRPVLHSPAATVGALTAVAAAGPAATPSTFARLLTRLRGGTR